MNASSTPFVQAGDSGETMTDKELVAYMKKIKHKKDFLKLEKEYVMSMNIKEVWSAFFDDGAKYSFDNALTDLGDEILSEGEWKEYTKKFDGEKALKHRKTTSVAKLPSNAMSTHIDNTRNSYLLKMTDTKLIIEEVNTGEGFKYADSSKATIRWEVYMPTAESEKSVMRVSWKFEWISKPWVGSSSIEETSTKKVKQTVAYIFKDYMPSKARRFS